MAVLRTGNLRSPAAAALGLYVLVVALLTSLAGAGVFADDALASSPRRVAEGKLWLLLANGLICDHPRGASFFALVLFGVVALLVCGPRVTAVAAVLGHVLSTLVVYALIGAVRLADAGAFAGVIGKEDLGISAVCAAWLGAIAAFVWQRNAHTRRAKAGVVLSCVVVGLCAWLVRSDLTPLDSDHLFAFAIGVATAVVALRRRAAVRERVDERQDAVVARPRLRLSRD